jgi:hypothetical protein
MKARYIYLIIFIFTCTFTACNNMSKQTTTEETNTNEAGPTKLKVTPSLTNTFTPEMTRTFVFAATRTPTPTNPTFTPQPVEKITSSKAMKLMDILSGSPECQPPCWNGITPGISHEWEEPNFFARLGVSPNNIELQKWPDGVTLGVFGENLPKSVYNTVLPDNIAVYSTGGIVNSISINDMKYTDLFNPERQFKMLGKPSEIKYTYLYDGYWLYLNYPEKHTSILMSGILNQVVDQGDIKKDDLCITPHDNRISITVYLYSSSAPEYNYQGFGAGWNDLHKELGIEYDELIEELNHPNPCISVLEIK